MQKQTWHARSLISVLVLVLVGCQLPSIVPKVTPKSPSNEPANQSHFGASKDSESGSRHLQSTNELVLELDPTWDGDPVLVNSFSGYNYYWSPSKPKLWESVRFSKVFTIPEGAEVIKTTTTDSKAAVIEALDSSGQPTESYYPRPGTYRIRVGAVFTPTTWYLQLGLMYKLTLTYRLPTKPKVEIDAHFNPGVVTPLKDKEKSLEKANVSKLYISTKQNGVGTKSIVRIKASTATYSGGHSHDNSSRPTGVFLLSSNKTATEWDVETDESGIAEINYRSSGFGGDDIVVVSAANADTKQANLRVSYDLVSLGFDGADRTRSGLDVPNMHLVGYTAAHPLHHWCTEKTRDFLTDPDPKNRVVEKWKIRAL